MVSVNVTVHAKIGTSVVGWWILACLLFLVPSSLIIAELSTAYPYQGGIYAWVHQACLGYSTGLGRTTKDEASNSLIGRGYICSDVRRSGRR